MALRLFWFAIVSMVAPLYIIAIELSLSRADQGAERAGFAARFG